MGDKMKVKKVRHGFSPRRTMCPHCKCEAIITQSVQVSELCRDLTFRCQNDECGHGFVAQLGILRTTVLSSTPDPKVRLPLSNRLQKYIIAAQLKANGMIEANQGELDV